MRLLALGLLVLLLVGCAPKTAAITGTDAVRVACEAFRPITYSSSGDTEQTRKEIAAHNRVFVELCTD